MPPDRIPRPIETVRLPMDAAAVQAEHRLRMVAALLALPAAVWLLSVGDHGLLWAMGVAALAFGALWLFRMRNVRGEALDPDTNYVDLTPEALVIVERGMPHSLPWRDAGDISIDEDALVVCVGQRSGRELRIEPRYGALGLHELAEIVYEYSLRAKTCTAAQDG